MTKFERKICNLVLQCNAQIFIVGCDSITLEIYSVVFSKFGGTTGDSDISRPHTVPTAILECITNFVLYQLS